MSDENLFLDNFEWSSEKLEMVSVDAKADVKQQEIKELVVKSCNSLFLQNWMAK